MEESTIGSLNSIGKYLDRYALKETRINLPASKELGLIVVIPSYKEPALFDTLISLLQCKLPPEDVEVIIVINCPENAPEEIVSESKIVFEDVKKWAEVHNSKTLTFHPILEINIPHKIAGPGYARKIGMDDATRRFYSVGKSIGIIVSLDADSTVNNNYFESIYSHWLKHPKCTGASIYFEHPLEGDLDERIYRGIIDYELHLRYYINAQIFCGFPFSYQTVGSSFAVSASAYAQQGGMNKRKAGEDFYFIQKIIPLGNYFNLNSTCVIPSSRPSDRVPFGTGRTISDFIKSKEETLQTYNFQSFIDLKAFLSSWELFFGSDKKKPDEIMNKLPQSIQSFLISREFCEEVQKINANTTNIDSFKKAFFRWFNAFTLMKFIHYSRDNFYPNVKMAKAVAAFCNSIGSSPNKSPSNKDYLLWFREMDKKLDQVE